MDVTPPDGSEQSTAGDSSSRLCPPAVDAVSPSPRAVCLPRMVLSVLLGQLLSVFICGTAVSSEYLQRAGVNTPIAQSFLNYMLLALVFGPPVVYRLTSRGRLWTQLHLRGHLYALAALVDVEANYLIVKAYQFTSVTSVQLLDCLTIPTVLLLSLLLFRIRYRLNHFLGVLLCILGVAGILVADYLGKGSTSGSNPFLGDVLVVAGAVCYGISNVAQEYLVRGYSKLDYMGSVGISACFFSGIQMLILERQEAATLLPKAAANPLIWLWFAMFALSMFALYTLMPVVMERSSAVLVNLNLLTADVYALVFGLFLFNYHFHWLYFVGYVAVMGGVFLYVIREPRRSSEETGCPSLLTKLPCIASTDASVA